MQNLIKAEVQLDQGVLSFETGLLAKQADSSIIARYGDTIVLSAFVVDHGDPDSEKMSRDFLPLTVEYREKFFSVGRIPGGFFKREGKPSTEEILVCRLIDRPLRPMFPDGLRNEIQVFSTVLSSDGDTLPDILAMNSACLAAAVSGVPFKYPIGSVRVGLIDGRFVINPAWTELEKSDLDLVITGTKTDVIMLEAKAKQVAEEKIIEAILFGQNYVRKIVEVQERIIEQVKPAQLNLAIYKPTPDAYNKVKEKFYNDIKQAFFIPKKKLRYAALDVIQKKIKDEFAAEEDKLPEYINAYAKIEEEIFRSSALEGKRADGRGTKDIRNITIDTSVLPRAHGSAIFTRGETQALATVTLGSKDDEQIIDSLIEYTKRFMLHYNFPSFSTGEVKPVRGPGRREIGHGALAEGALESIIPDEADFPYTIRLVSEILESNGSTSMATVCAGTLALMDAGVKIKAPVAGIAMGLIKEGDQVAILSDILGSEDASGDMDFKVAGTETGVTAIQLDLKTPGISIDIMKKAMDQAKDGRLHILSKMKEAISEPRATLSKYAPKIVSIPVPREKIGLIIGPGGKTIREITAKTGVEIEIDDDRGVAMLISSDQDAIDQAKTIVTTMVEGLTLGNIYKVVVKELRDFGALVEVPYTQQGGMIHVSEIADGYVQHVEEYLKPGVIVDAKLIQLDEFQRGRFSIKQASKELGKPNLEKLDSPGVITPRPPRRFAPRRRDDY